MRTNKYGAVCAAADCQTYVPPGGGLLMRGERGWLTYCPADDPGRGDPTAPDDGPDDADHRPDGRPDDEHPHEPVADFLRDRLDEELETAGAAGITSWRHWPRRSQRVVDDHDELVVEAPLRVVADHIATWGPWPAIQNAYGRRAVLDLFEAAKSGPAREALRDAVRALAMAYREHPDYDPIWTLPER
ncbi:DUF6221 family protein [Kitasatospora sp. NPDC127111]|uniref:DUF6221 family protein n=1 Tax=Kitasatospora sp. NPDC127111 TaxID=3345363 RepID=UPI003629D81E